jgi:spoIIIJ-associated protein
MEWVVTTGRTVEDAVDHALDQLGVDENEIEYEVVDEGAKGLLGRFGARPARIRARVRPVSREKPDTRRRRRRPGGREGDEGAGSGGSDRAVRSGGRDSDEASTVGAGGAERGGRRSGGESGRGGDRPRGGGRSGGGNGSGSGARAGTSAGAGSEGRRRTGSGPAAARREDPGADEADSGARVDNGRHDARRPAARPEPRARGSERQGTLDDEELTMSEPVDLEDQARVATEFVEGLTRVMKLAGTVTAEVTEDDVIHVDVRGDELGLLIGPRGATIEAVHELVKSALQRHTGGQGGRVSVDVAGYREKRRQALESFVEGVAAKALESGRDQVLDPMNSADRKVVHDAVATIDGVVSESQGEEPRRRVVIKRA